jgi:hypothetical protein
VVWWLIIEPQFFADSFFVKKPERVETILFIMSLCLLVYNLGQRELRKTLLWSNNKVRNQLGKLTNTPTLRWVFQCFQVVHFLRINQSPKVVNLTEERSLILEFLPSSCQKYYLGNNNQDLRSTAIYGAKIIIFKILPLYIVPLRKS